MEDDALDARRLIWVLFSRKWQILAATLLIVVPVLILTLLTEPLYRSTTLIEVMPEGVQVLPYRELGTPTRGDNYLPYMTTQEQILKGPGLQQRLARRFASGEDAASTKSEVSRLYSRVAIGRLPNSHVLTISYLAPRPELAAQIANTWAEEFIKAHFESRQETRERAREMLRRELRTLEDRVQASEKQLVTYAQAYNIQRAAPNQGDLADTKLSTLAAQVTAAEADVMAARARLEPLQRASMTDFPDKLITAVIADRASTLLRLEHELTALRASFGENWPAVVQKRNELALVRDQLDREKAAALAQAREQALLEVRAAESRRAMMAGSLKQQQDVVTQLQNASIQYNIIRRDVETNQKLYEGLLERLQQTGVAPGMELGNLRVIEPAVPDNQVASPNLVWNLLLASILGLSFGVAVALGRDYWSNSMSTVEEVEHVTVLPVLACVPLIRTGRAGRTLRSTGPVRLLLDRVRDAGGARLARRPPQRAVRLNLAHSVTGAEAVRTLCASILLSRSERPPRLLAVTSAVPGEGKTTLATELARALADSGARTLLVECDMRRPAFGSVFGVGNEGGLSLFLAGHVPRVKMYPTSSDKLYVVTAGPTAPNPVALLNSEKMNAFLADMTASFDFVILDTPPVLPLADARVLGAKAEGVVLVVRAGYTSRNLLRRVRSVLDASGANVLGAVLNAAESEGLGSSYYRYYHSYDEA